LPDYSLPLGLEEPISISILASGIDISLSFSLVYGNAHDLNGSWGWENPNGTTETRESYLVIPI
jgi:hypothetical protein